MSRATWISMVVLFGLFLATTLALRDPGDSEQWPARIDARLDGISGRIDEVDESVNTLRASVAALEQGASDSEAVVQRLEQETRDLRERGPNAQAEAEVEAEADTASYRALTSDDKQSSPEQNEADFRRLLDGVLGGGPTASPEDQELFWKLARTGDTIDRIIDDLEAFIENDPDDHESRMELADTYVAKLLTVASGPERGVWGTKAENQWKEVASRDETHWESRFKMGNSLSYYPAFLNRTPEAIDWLEKGVKLLDRQPVEDRHAENYARLASIYQREGKVDLARTTLNAGLTRHPDHVQMTSLENNLKESD